MWHRRQSAFYRLAGSCLDDRFCSVAFNVVSIDSFTAAYVLGGTGACVNDLVGRDALVARQWRFLAKQATSSGITK